MSKNLDDYLVGASDNKQRWSLLPEEFKKIFEPFIIEAFHPEDGVRYYSYSYQTKFPFYDDIQEGLNYFAITYDFALSIENFIGAGLGYISRKNYDEDRNEKKRKQETGEGPNKKKRKGNEIQAESTGSIKNYNFGDSLEKVNAYKATMDSEDTEYKDDPKTTVTVLQLQDMFSQFGDNIIDKLQEKLSKRSETREFTDGYSSGYVEGYKLGYNDGFTTATCGTQYVKPNQVTELSPVKKNLTNPIILEYAVQRMFKGSIAPICKFIYDNSFTYSKGNDVVHSKEISIKDALITSLSIYAKIRSIESEAAIIDSNGSTEGDILVFSNQPTDPSVHIELKNSISNEIHGGSNDWEAANKFSKSICNQELDTILKLQLRYYDNKKKAYVYLNETVADKWQALIKQTITNHKKAKTTHKCQFSSYAIYRVGLHCVLYSGPIVDNTTRVTPMKLIID